MRLRQILVVLVTLGTWVTLAVVWRQHPEDWRSLLLGVGVAGVAGALATLAMRGRRLGPGRQQGDSGDAPFVAVVDGHGGGHASPDSGGHSSGGDSGGDSGGGGGDGGGGDGGGGGGGD